MNRLQRFKITVRGYRTIHELIPGYLLSTGVRYALTALLPFINIYMSGRIITALSLGAPWNDILILMLVTIALNFLTTLVSSLLERVSEYRGSMFWELSEKPLNEKIQRMDYENVEDTAVHQMRDRIDLVRRTNGLGLPRLVWCYGGLIQSVATIVFSVSLVLSAFTSAPAKPAGAWSFLFSPWAAAVMAVLILANVVWDIYRAAASTRKQASIFADFQSANRIGGYYYNQFFEYKAGKDLKLYALKELCIGDMMGLNDVIVSGMRRLQAVAAKYDGLGAVTTTLTGAAIYAFVSLKALFGGFGVGSIVQYVGSLTQFSQGLSDLMYNVTMLRINAEALHSYFEFIDLPDKKYLGTLPVEKHSDIEYEIEFHNVSFKYPGSPQYALRNVSLKLHIGERLAVVGMNGSGKTTMIKLLCRLYDPTEGTITLNDIDIKKYDYNEYLSIFSVVFQDFKLFSFPLGQNVAANAGYDREKVEACLKKVGMAERCKGMAEGPDTCLYKDFDEAGVEISGGEAQKIALARALYKGAPFVVLDEPTAALDPIAEYDIYTRFDAIVGGRTAVYISHRLSSCRFCDDIAVFHEGRVVQRGSHEALLKDEKGKYAELWNAQAQYYREEDSGSEMGNAS